jgi:hypothetical protein
MFISTVVRPLTAAAGDAMPPPGFLSRRGFVAFKGSGERSRV